MLTMRLSKKVSELALMVGTMTMGSPLMCTLGQFSGCVAQSESGLSVMVNSKVPPLYTSSKVMKLRSNGFPFSLTDFT